MVLQIDDRADASLRAVPSKDAGVTKSLVKGAEGEAICFATGRCSLGAILVAATQKGVRAIELGDSESQLRASFQQRIAKTRRMEADENFNALFAKVAAFIDEPGKALGLPLDVRGTAFQHKVWHALQAIPFGTTISYAELAATIGAPGAVRAVANACANNKVAVAVPCHRVVRSDGSLSGYRWGVARKCALLERERGGKDD